MRSMLQNCAEGPQTYGCEPQRVALHLKHGVTLLGFARVESPQIARLDFAWSGQDISDRRGGGRRRSNPPPDPKGGGSLDRLTPGERSPRACAQREIIALGAFRRYEGFNPHIFDLMADRIAP
jgi:hypothetical protein